MKRLGILLPALLAFQVGVQPALAWTWPVDGPVLQTFNVDSNPYAGGQHRGIEVGAPVGTPVLAPTGGTVSFAGSVAANGRTVTIQTAEGLSVTLVQLGTIGVSNGADVAEGVPVGTVGPSVDSKISEPHVHLGIRRTSDPNGYLDPLGFLPARPASEPPPEPEPVPAPIPAPAAEQPVGPAPIRVGPAPAEPAQASPSRNVLRERRASRPARAEEGTRIQEPWRPRSPGAVRPSGRELRSFEPAAVRAPASAFVARPEGPNPLLFAAATLVAALAAGLAVLRRQLLDADAADRAAPVLLEGFVATAEDADALRLGEENRVVLDGDLERILFTEAEALADLDGDHDPAELVYVADDPRSRHSSGGLGRCLDRLSGRHGLQARRTLRPGSRVSVPPRCAF
jgi:peptidase M23-like protein